MISAIPLKIVGNPTPAQEGESTAFLIFSGSDGREHPISLGEGKFARVYLGSTAEPLRGAGLDPGQFVAIKFLKKDSASAAVTKNGIFRFCREAMETARACRLGLNRDALVTMYGYGRFGKLPPAGDPVRQVMEDGFRIDFASERNDPHDIFGTLTPDQLDERFNRNTANLQQGGFDPTDLTGDFYVLELCLMTLEEILLARGDPYGRSAGQAFEQVGVSHAPVLQQRSADLRQMQAAERTICLAADATGFQDLEAIQDWVNARQGGSDGRFVNATLFSLWTECANRLKVLHEAGLKNGEFGLAHRDLKPANILIQAGAELHLRLADLGFLASVSDIADGHYTLISSVDEGGALPTGSRGFRAPEQIQTGDELSFVPLKPGATTVQLLPYLDENINPGDWLRVSGTFSDDTAIARITRGDPDTNIYEFSPAFKGPADVSKARLIPDVSLHSDVFSLGSLAYFLASEGRNPEGFYRQYLDEIALKSFSASLPGWVLACPLWFAAVLCQDAAPTVVLDLQHFVDAVLPEERVLLNGKPGDFDAHWKVINRALGDLPLLRGEAQKIKKFRQGLQTSNALAPLLSSRVKRRPIPFPFIAAICLCCMRDRPGSVVRRNSEAIPSASSTGQSTRIVYSAIAHTFARRIADLASHLARGPSVREDSDLLTIFGDRPREQFIRLRLAGNRKAITTQTPTPVSVPGALSGSSATNLAEARGPGTGDAVAPPPASALPH